MNDDGRRLFDPDPARGNQRGPRDAARLLPAWLYENASPRMRARLEAAVEESLTGTKPAVRPCAWLGCPRPGTEDHHTLPKELFGRLAEFGPLIWLCVDHHGLVSAVFAEARRHRTSIGDTT